MVGTSLIRHPSTEPDRSKQSWAETWQGPDRGLIKCWETGRTLATQSPDLATRCKAGELPLLHWKGGVARQLKKKEKFGALSYLAQWQGLRGQDLEIDLDVEVTLTCSATGMVVTFTPDVAKLVEPQDNAEEGENNG